jgi:hypothetical protein
MLICLIQIIFSILGKKIVYTYLATKDVSLGPLGRIKSPDSNCQTTFKCSSSSSRVWYYISVDRVSGTLRLKQRNTRYLTKQRSGIYKLIPATKIQIKNICSHGTYIHDVTVNLFVFPYNFGDHILQNNGYSFPTMRVEANHHFDTGKGMASSLHRMMRMITKDENRIAYEKMMASVKVKTALEGAINKIVQNFVTKSPGKNNLVSTEKTRLFLLQFLMFRTL